MRRREPMIVRKKKDCMNNTRYCTLLTVWLMIWLLAPSVRSQPTQWEANVNRAGGDYRDFDVQDAGVCQKACDLDSLCLAWSFIKPARCHFKSRSSPPKRTEDGTISGISRRQRPIGKADG